MASQPAQITPPQGNGGSRESSEFEFVNVQNRSSQPPVLNNPLLLSSNHPAPGPGILTTPTYVKPSLPPVMIQPPTPQILTPAPAMAQSVSVPANMDQTKVSTVTAESPPAPGMFGWVKGSGFLSKVVEKTKSVTENVITTLDPQMKEFIHSGGDVEVVVTSDKDDKVSPVREAFQSVFGQATVYGLPSKCVSIAEQPVGFASGKQAALERISSLRKSDPQRKIVLQTFSQPTNVEAAYVEKLREATSDTYPKQWSGFAITTGEVMGEVYNVPSPAWQEAVTGVHRRRLVLLASQALAGMYRRALMANIENI